MYKESEGVLGTFQNFKVYPLINKFILCFENGDVEVGQTYNLICFSRFFTGASTVQDGNQGWSFFQDRYLGLSFFQDGNLGLSSIQDGNQGQS